MIHKTYSKQDLKDIISDLKINIHNYDTLNKNELINALLQYLKNDNIIDFSTSEYFKNKNINYLKNYLSQPNPNKVLSVKDRNNILVLCKEIIHYCKTGYCVENTIFGSVDEIKIHMDYIKQFGDIPSVRRCCKLIKGDLKMDRIFYPEISIKVQKDLDIKAKNKLKNKKVNGLILKKGKFKVIFD